MILTRIVGGLGNQMFQYASGLGLARKLGTEVVVDNNYYRAIPEIDTPRVYGLDHLNFEVPKVNGIMLRFFTDGSFIPGKFFRRLTKRYFLQYTEKNLKHDPEMLNQKDKTYLVGNWQNEKYFLHIEPEIRTKFQVVTPANAYNQQILQQMQGKTVIGVHIRRGDYVKLQEIHGLAGPDYYTKALAHMAEKFPGAIYLVFSDDPEWCKQNIKPAGETIYSENDGDHNYEDLRLMYSCSHFIVANSSFSWWGAWLIPNPEKVIVAPQIWFVGEGMESEIVPDRWVRI
jgi:hypothetical protein